MFRQSDGQVQSILLENVDRLEYQGADTSTGEGDQILVSNDNQELPPLPSLINQVPVPQPLGVAPDLDDWLDEDSTFG
ncbi:MAG: hypothetical protein KDA70_19120, partial [Planctomycetaceae bacterium]|nr:hypothetical protein [Planctomycetaceae bacterium]